MCHFLIKQKSKAESVFPSRIQVDDRRYWGNTNREEEEEEKYWEFHMRLSITERMKISLCLLVTSNVHSELQRTINQSERENKEEKMFHGQHRRSQVRSGGSEVKRWEVAFDGDVNTEEGNVQLVIIAPRFLPRFKHLKFVPTGRDEVREIRAAIQHTEWLWRCSTMRTTSAERRGEPLHREPWSRVVIVNAHQRRRKEF